MADRITKLVLHAAKLESENTALRARVAGLEAAIAQAIQGHWEAKTSNSYVRENNYQWGNFPTKEHAEVEAKKAAGTHNDTASEGYAVYVTDLDGAEILNLLSADSIARGKELLAAEELLTAIEQQSGPIGNIEPPEAFPDRKWTVWEDGGDGHLGRGDTLREALTNTLKRLKGESK